MCFTMKINKVFLFLKVVEIDQNVLLDLTDFSHYQETALIQSCIESPQNFIS